jgi:hypothetical protein
LNGAGALPTAVHVPVNLSYFITSLGSQPYFMAQVIAFAEAIFRNIPAQMQNIYYQLFTNF